jgi:acyl-coenzyme A synthetase/AMP-(fatty) acid ligase
MGEGALSVKVKELIVLGIGINTRCGGRTLPQMFHDGWYLTGDLACKDSDEYFWFISKLPRTRSGKIMRRRLKAQEPGLPIGDTSTLEES